MKIENPILKNYIKELLQNNFRVYRNAGEEKVKWIYVEKNNNIGYVQEDDFMGCLHFSTVHKPSREAGTGFRTNDEPVCKPTVKDAEKTFILKPHWAYQDISLIKKYKSFDDYTKTGYGSILKYKEIKLDDVA